MFKLTISLSQVIMNPLALVKQLLTVINVCPGYKTQYFNLISAVYLWSHSPWSMMLQNIFSVSDLIKYCRSQMNCL